jgi:hypothetical protein
MCANGRYLSALAGHTDGLVDGRLRADALDGHVRPAPTGQLADLRDDVLVRPSGHRVGGPDPARQVQLRGDGVDGDDPPRAGQPCTLDGSQPDAAATDHGHRVVVADRRRVGRRPESGDHTAAEQ